jgi:hypothetical protein
MRWNFGVVISANDEAESLHQIEGVYYDISCKSNELPLIKHLVLSYFYSKCELIHY